MKKLLLFLLLISPMVAQAETTLVELTDYRTKVYWTTHLIQEEWEQGTVNCSLTTTYYNYGGKNSKGSTKVCNLSEYNCNYLGICPSSGGGGSSETDALLQAILDKLSEPQEVKEYPWDRGMSKRRK